MKESDKSFVEPRGVYTALAGAEESPDITPTASPGRVALRWVLVAAMAAFIFYMSSRTAGELNTGFFSQVKQMLNAWLLSSFGIAGDPASTIAHFCEYLLLGALFVNALRSHMSLSRALVVAIVCASAYGVTDEIHQTYVEGRYCDVFDWLTDTAGATLGAALFNLMFKGLR